VIQRYAVNVLAVLGVAGTLAAIVIDNREPAAREPAVTPAAPPFASFAAGAGLIEASTGNISIGSPAAGIATEIYVRVGDFVDTGQVLFRIDDRDLQAQLVTARASAKAAHAALELPRHRLDYSEDLRRRDPSAVSTQALTELRDQVVIAEANVGIADAQVTRLEMDVERRAVRAPVAGRVLQLDLRLGEYVDGGTMPVLLFGDDRTLFVRVDVDESDARRVRPGASAVAFVRGSQQVRIPLKFEYVEPHVIPKMSLTGRSTERSDTRVLQVLYSFSHGELPVYVGQQLDVFIEAPPVEAIDREMAH
jgi:HlyD family secretion protein